MVYVLFNLISIKYLRVAKTPYTDSICIDALDDILKYKYFLNIND